MGTSVSDETAFSFFREEEIKPYPEDGGSGLLQNIGTCLQNDIV
jgi:hypothetical protein